MRRGGGDGAAVRRARTSTAAPEAAAFRILISCLQPPPLPLSLSLSSPPRCDALHQRRWSDWLALLGSMALRTGSVPQFSQFLVSGILVDGLEIDQIVFSPLWFSVFPSRGLLIPCNICYQLAHPSTLPGWHGRPGWSVYCINMSAHAWPGRPLVTLWMEDEGADRGR